MRGDAAVNMHHLIYLDTVLRTGSFAAASRELNVTPQAVSKAITTLEDNLGYPLFERHGRRIVPADYAHCFAQPLREAVDQLRAAESLMHPGSALVAEQGELSLGIGTFSLRGSVRPEHLLDSFAAQWPRVSVHAHEALNETCHYRLAAGSFDAVIVAGKPCEAGVIAHHVGDTPLMLALKADHPLAARETVRARDLKGMPLAAPVDQRFLEPLIRESFARVQVSATFATLPPHREDHDAFLQQGGGIIAFADTPLAASPQQVALKRFAPSLRLRVPLYIAHRPLAEPSPVPLLVRHFLYDLKH